MTKMLITGSTGLVGSYLYEAAQNRYDVIGLSNSDGDTVDVALDLTDPAAWKNLLHELKPDVVVHTAALTWVDFCETHHAETDALNIAPVQVLADYAKSASTTPRVVFFSSDYVYDGKRSQGAYTEEDPVMPQNYYAETKVRGEEIVATIPGSLIVRPGVIFGWQPEGKNFFMQTYTTLREGKDMRVVNDQINNPTYVETLNGAILKALDLRLSGTYIATGKKSYTRFGFAKEIALAFGFDPELIQPAKTSDFPSAAKRPMNCSTDSSKFQNALHMQFPSMDEIFQMIKKRIDAYL